ncbi:MAG: VWA domain-containing protein [Saprospiraceae bacterium]|nr:VWA domain-containing protein [Candidatus Defluviibacterium haderslevense]MBL0238617.1 VWA domain-containing protein [Candidatus Defluviibacterium haderslevense]
MLSEDSRWRLVLGKTEDEDDAIELSSDDEAIDDLLSSLYTHGKTGGLGKSSHKIRKWMDGLRSYFPPGIVRIMQQDALERQGIKEMLLEPELLEQIEPDINMVATILQLQQLLPDKTKSVARTLVQKLVKELEKKLKPKLQFAVQSGLFSRSKPVHPTGSIIDWKKTIHRNIKNYQPDQLFIIPEVWYGYKQGYKINEIILLIDKSESMISSAIYASIIGSILASLKSVQTHIIFFDTAISDVTNQYHDPVDILFSVPMGGGTDIAYAMNYVHQKIKIPSKAILFLISDLDEGGSIKDLLSMTQLLLNQGLQIQCLLGLNDSGMAEYNHKVASEMANLKIPVFTCSPEEFPNLIAKELQRN